MNAVSGSGTINMSLSLIACQPRIEEPSNPSPFSNTPSSISPIGNEQCCHVPGQSVKRRSTILTLFFLAYSSTSLAFIRSFSPLSDLGFEIPHRRAPGGLDSNPWISKGLDGARAPLARADPDRLFHLEHEDLAVADAARVGGFGDRIHRLVGEFVRHHELDLDLRQEIDDVLGAAIQLGMALLASEALHLGDGHALNADALQRFLDLVELERLHDRFDLLHGADLLTLPPMVKIAPSPSPETPWLQGWLGGWSRYPTSP